ncbi:MAG TPA: nodulation protein NfeD [Actinomycetota bacterium]|nr:nodulation protein NfeD [Actinomycetota bacterium]
MRLRRGVACLAFLAGTALLPTALAQTESHSETVDMIEVRGVIDPPVADYLIGRLRVANRDGVHAAVIQLDTPGGLDVSMREIIGEILESRVPVVVWIAPRGARAASAGTFITYAAHLAYMAEATEIGAATPVNLGGESSEALERKVTNDAAAFIRELATTRGRNAEWAVRAVREASSLGATDAVDLDVVNGIASSPTDLLQALDGREVDVPENHSVVLETWDDSAGAPSVRLRFQNMNLLQQLLHAVTNPEIALLLMMLGTFGLIFEIYNPGIGLAGILGAVALLLGFYALSVLPTNWAGVLLVMLGIVFFVVDLHAAGLGIWTAGGVAALIAGSLIIFSGVDPAVALDPWAIVVAVVLTVVFFISVMTAALRVRLRRPITGEEGIVGTVAEAKTDIAPEGTVLTKGTLWRARTMETGIAAGAKVKVMATEGLVLLVEPMHEGES